VAGLAGVAWVNWYFLLGDRDIGRAAVAARQRRGAQEIRITIHGGYDPAVVRVVAGRPVHLVFDRQETSSCSEEIVIPAFGVRRFLPAYQTTTLEITPPAPGTYEFACGMGMLHGRLIAE
jgi:plastocyanin domain-containing protein